MAQSKPFDNGWALAGQPSPNDVRRVLKHARLHGWFDESDDRSASEEESFSYLHRYVADHVISHGAPSLFRTGMTVTNQSDNWALLAWKSRVIRVAEPIIAAGVVEYRPLDVSWLMDLVRLSARKDGPARAKELLLSKGIVLVAEPHIAGTSLDGAAFLVGEVPVIGMTLLRDRLDNFWFTLLHEVAHVILHHRTGLTAGFTSRGTTGTMRLPRFFASWTSHPQMGEAADLSVSTNATASLERISPPRRSFQFSAASMSCLSRIGSKSRVCKATTSWSAKATSSREYETKTFMRSGCSTAPVIGVPAILNKA